MKQIAPNRYDNHIGLGDAPTTAKVSCDRLRGWQHIPAGAAKQSTPVAMATACRGSSARIASQFGGSDTSSTETAAPAGAQQRWHCSRNRRKNMNSEVMMIKTLRSSLRCLNTPTASPRALCPVCPLGLTICSIMIA